MQSGISNLEFVQGVIFEFLYPLTNNGRKYSLFSDNSCEEISCSNEFVDIVLADRHHEMSTFYNKQNLFYQSKPGEI